MQLETRKEHARLHTYQIREITLGAIPRYKGHMRDRRGI